VCRAVVVFSAFKTRTLACFDFAERSKYLSHENKLQSGLKAEKKVKAKAEYLY
jgi:hypothetical protein